MYMYAVHKVKTKGYMLKNIAVMAKILLWKRKKYMSFGFYKEDSSCV